jgi:hypothetical protein
MVDNNPDRLFVTPVSLADGLKRADSKTWPIILTSAAVAIVLVLVLNLFIERKPLQWGGGQPPAAETKAAPADAASANAAGTEPPAKEEPRTYDVAPPNAVPQKK